MQQQTHKNFQSSRSHSPASAILAKGTLTLDEFKFGFPSTGLSAVSNRWWESSSRDDSKISAEVKSEAKQPECEPKEFATPGNVKETVSRSVDPESLTAIRKRAVEEGREALKLGVCKPNAIQKPSSKQKKLLLKIFGPSLPSEWLDINNS